MARAMPDLELVLVDMNILVPDIRQALYELRISPTTGDVPIALLAADGRSTRPSDWPPSTRA